MTPYSIKIPRHLSLENQIALGKFDQVSKDFREVFPSAESNGQMEVYLHEPKDKETIQAWQGRIDAEGYVSLGISELCALGAQYQELQRSYTILALGSVWRDPGGSLASPELWSGDGEREARTSWCSPDTQWLLPRRALVSRKLSLDTGKLGTS